MQRSLLFVSPRFLFPTDSGGKIRTTQILRALKGGAFSITLASPIPDGAEGRFANEIDSVSNQFAGWRDRHRGPWFPIARLRHGLSPVPVSVATDRSRRGSRLVRRELDRRPDVVVVDFAHAAVLVPDRIDAASVLFTHNVESWIFERHARVARNLVLRLLWRDQWRKMERFEGAVLRRFDMVIAVSERDAQWFRERLGVRHVGVIPTGVDLEYFQYRPPQSAPRVVFTGSMDWLANQDGIAWFRAEVWPRVAARRPDATMCVVGRTPPAALIQKLGGPSWRFTGFVEDVRPHVAGSAAYVVPLRVGGGTRIKVFEAMAAGCPVISTTVGVEGLPLTPEQHYLRADSPTEFAHAVLRLLSDEELRQRLSRAARRHVEEHFAASRAGAELERLCIRTLERRQGERSAAPQDYQHRP